jgi:uncharacterized protein YndB with AHSA1/START domain
MEFGSIERELRVDAPPDVVFDVVSSPEHIADWWSADTSVEATAGSTGELVWTDAETGRCDVARIVVADAQPPRLFSFRWTHEADGPLHESNSMLVTFELTSDGDGGTVLRMTETGFREQGWEAAVLEAQYNDHVQGWAFYLPRLQARAESRRG